ncbi:hypothetical protein PIB30_077891 [Stylosanthes scabra]|uniref:Uncharacterized protein n=1 Tax=Stylosanthes scabra TaxID=79078 RepID=A0ABU6SRL0_9FABA|nr:hypothetical protein [Stylosanthes scabra]
MQTNAEKGRPMFYGCLKSNYGASSSSQVDPNEPVPLRTVPPFPGFRPPHPPPNKKNEERKLEEQERKKLEHSGQRLTPRRGDSRLGVQSISSGLKHPRA